MSTPTRSVQVATMCAEAFRYGAAVLLQSVAAHCTAEELRFFVLDMGLKPRTRDALAETVRRCGRPASLTFVDPAASVTYRSILRILKYRGRNFRDRLYFAKLAIPELLSAHADRVLYLDADIYCGMDLAALKWEMASRPVCGVLDGPLTADGYSADFEIAGLDGTAPYFNGGFIGLNLDHWNRHGLSEAAVALTDQVTAAMPDRRVAFSEHAKASIHKHGGVFSDQAVFNILFYRNWEILPADWNVQSPFCYGAFIELAAGKRMNLHYVTSPKPWQVPAEPNTAFFYEALDHTAYRGWRPNPVYWSVHKQLRIIKYRLSLAMRRRQLRAGPR
jgi:lipopolysaccharide biosynthesis glycosyltransferase